jgi:hypothetical protein
MSKQQRRPNRRRVSKDNRWASVEMALRAIVSLVWLVKTLWGS